MMIVFYIILYSIIICRQLVYEDYITHLLRWWIAAAENIIYI